jgi:hypothetical protein
VTFGQPLSGGDHERPPVRGPTWSNEPPLAGPLAPRPFPLGEAQEADDVLGAAPETHALEVVRCAPVPVDPQVVERRPELTGA